ncbi:MAG: transposase, partial [Lachnospiraceae bacterium]|nr:transposase [Lachnospiraceae bacterium]
GTGFYLLYIRLSNGRFQWPRNSDEARDISPEQYKRFIEGFAIDSSIKDYKKHEEAPNN